MSSVEFDWDRGQSPASLAKKFKKFDEALDDHLEQTMDTVVTYIAGVAAEKAPYEYGTLSGNVRGAMVPIMNNVVRGAIGTNVNYGPYQEYGPEKYDVEFDASPYIRPAIRENIDWAMEQFEQAVKDAADEVFG